MKARHKPHTYGTKETQMTDTYEPTVEQIEALLHDAFEAEAMFDSDDTNGVWVAEARWDAVKPGLARHIREHPAFQAIIRAAQAEAVRSLADPGTLQLRDGVGSPWMVAEWMNAEADRIEAADE